MAPFTRNRLGLKPGENYTPPSPHSSGDSDGDYVEDGLEAVPLTTITTAAASPQHSKHQTTNSWESHTTTESQRESRSANGSTCLVFGGAIALLFSLGFFLLVVLSFKNLQITTKNTTTFSAIKNFITVNGTQFIDGCHPFYVIGINIDNIVEAAIPEVSQAVLYTTTRSGKEMIDEVLSKASLSGINVLRTWAHTTDPGHPLQQFPGRYSKDVFSALDYVISQAEAVGIRVSLSLVDTWRYKGGVAEFIDWSTTAPKRDSRYPPLIVEGDVTPEMMTPERELYESRRRALFFTDPDSKSMYKHHMKAILSRRNTITGKIYSQDPAIFGFGLINEPRCDVVATPGCADMLQLWIEEMAAHFRTLDSHHLLTVGEEGFWGLDDPSDGSNPGYSGGSRWAAGTGQNFIKNHALPAGISYAAIHAWPSNWFPSDALSGTTEGFLTAWIEQHVRDSMRRLGKPLLLEEVGKKVEPAPGTPSQIAALRDPVYETVYRNVERSLSEGDALQGSSLWQLEFLIYSQSPSTPYGVLFNDSTWKIVENHAKKVKKQALLRRLEESAVSFCAEGGGERRKECWIPRSKNYFLGLLHRCVNKPAVCEALARKRELESNEIDVFGSEIECCNALGGCGSASSLFL